MTGKKEVMNVRVGPVRDSAPDEDTYSPLVDIFQDNDGTSYLLAEIPGAVPQSLGRGSVPAGNMAWVRLLAAMAHPRRLKCSSMSARLFSSRASSHRIALAIACRVRSSSVGPSPPVMMISSASRQHASIAPRICSSRSLTVTCRTTRTPTRASSRDSHAEFVSTLCPVINSCPTLTIAAFTTSGYHGPSAKTNLSTGSKSISGAI